MKIQQIFFSIPQKATPEEINQKEEEAKEALKRITKGEEFEELISKFSRNPSVRVEKDCGFFKRGELLPPLEKAAFSLKEGGVSSIIRSPLGYHIIKVLEKKGAKPRPLKEVEDKIYDLLFQGEIEKEFDRFMKDLRKETLIEIRL